MTRAAVLIVVAQMVAAGSFVGPAPRSTPPPLVQTAATDWAAVLASYVSFCRTSARPDYYVDCLSERFAHAAARMDPYSRTTADLRQALQAAASDLAAVATRYHAAGAGETTPRSATITPTRPLRAIAPQNRAAARTAGLNVLNATELVLLRSATRDPALTLAFTAVAKVIGTAKLLLRAA